MTPRSFPWFCALLTVSPPNFVRSEPVKSFYIGNVWMRPAKGFVRSCRLKSRKLRSFGFQDREAKFLLWVFVFVFVSQKITNLGSHPMSLFAQCQFIVLWDNISRWTWPKERKNTRKSSPYSLVSSTTRIGLRGLLLFLNSIPELLNHWECFWKLFLTWLMRRHSIVVFPDNLAES